MITQQYKNLQEREIAVRTSEAAGLYMLHDDYDTDWTRGQEPHGTLTFDMPPPPKPTTPQPPTKIQLDYESASLEGRLAMIARHLGFSR